MEVEVSQVGVERVSTQVIPPSTQMDIPSSTQMNTPSSTFQMNTPSSTQMNTPPSTHITPPSTQITPPSTQINSETNQKPVQNQLRKSIYFTKTQPSSNQTNPNPPHVLYPQLLPKENQPQNSYQRRIMPNHPFLS